MIESQHCVHKSKRKTKREKLAPQKTFQKIYVSISIYIYIDIDIYMVFLFFFFFVKALREGERESNKMYGNKLAGHAN